MGRFRFRDRDMVRTKCDNLLNMLTRHLDVPLVGFVYLACLVRLK